MTKDQTSLLLIATDEELNDTVGKALAGQSDIAFSTEPSRISDLNGKGVRLAAHHDILVFEIDPDEEAEMEALDTLSRVNNSNGLVLSVTKEDLPLSKVRALSKHGVDDVLPLNALHDELSEQVNLWRQRRDAQLPAVWTGYRELGKVITVAQARGGIGSTTIAVNLADELAGPRKFGKRVDPKKVVIADFDFQFGTVCDQLDGDTHDGLLQMAMDGTVPTAADVREYLVEMPNGISALPAPPRFGPLDALRPDQVEAVVTELRNNFDYVVVDLPRALVPWIDPVLDFTDRLVLVTDVTVPSIRAAKKLSDFFLTDHPTLKFDIVVNHEKKPRFLSAKHKAAIKLMERRFDHWIPDNSRTAREALDRGKPIAEVAPRSDISKAIRLLAQDTIKSTQNGEES